METQPLIQRDCKIVNSDVEGQSRIVHIVPIRLSKDRVGLGVLISLMTASLFALACSWSVKLTKCFFFRNCRFEQATHFWVQNEDKTFSIVKRRVHHSVLYFVNRKLRYVFDSKTQVFRPLEFALNTMKNSEVIKQGLEGIKDYQQQYQRYGPCKIDIPIPSVFAYLFKELTAPFYILQYVTCVLWVAENYAVLAVVMVTISVSITWLNYLLLISSIKKLREMAKHKQNVKVIRAPNPYPVTIESETLVPGDLIVIESGLVIPCDCVVIQGELLMNEASLTGESVPIQKEGLQDNDEMFGDEKKNWLYEGTKVLVTRTIGEQEHVLAWVVRTGFSSFKGQIFRSVLYPKPQKFTFYTQAIKFLTGLGAIILIIYFAELYKFIQIDLKPILIGFRFGDAITWIIPPAMPIFISMCMTFSLLRLRKYHRIFGVDSQKTLEAGKVNTCCFDKTGTLTTNSIDVNGYQLSTMDGVPFLQNVIYANTNEDRTHLVFKLFGSCHGVAKIDDELLGDSLDIEMLRYSGYQVKDKFCINGSTSLEVLRNNEFESSLQRMSVLVRYNEKYYIFLKGSPEKVSDLSESKSIPHNLKQSLETLTMKGLRVLGMGYREVAAKDVQRLMHAHREEMEEHITFMGLLIMENKLKADTAGVIAQLSESGLDLKIISGDNGLTTIQCARECNVLETSQPMLLIDYNERTKLLTLEEVDQSGVQQDKEPSTSFSDDYSNSNTTTNEDTIKRLRKHLQLSETTKGQKKSVKSTINHDPKDSQLDEVGFGFALTGKAFSYFQQLSPRTRMTVRRPSIDNFDNQLNSEEWIYDQIFIAILQRAKVFARMRPEQKSQIIEQLQKQGRSVLMIGDGANDCAAIKQANVGISFAQSDAAYAAPFSTQSESIDCVRLVLLDGRASLTSAVEVFQYYILVSVLKYVGAMTLALQGQNYSTVQMILVNYVATLPFLGALTLSQPSKKLSKSLPLDDMVRIPNEITIYFHMTITSVGLVLNYYYWLIQDWREHIPSNYNGEYIQEGQAQTVLFLCGMVYFVALIFSIYSQRPFKQPIYSHVIMMILLVLMTTFTALFFFSYQNWMYDFLQIIDLQGQGNFLRVELGISVVVSLFMIIFGHFIIRRLAPITRPLFD